MSEGIILPKQEPPAPRGWPLGYAPPSPPTRIIPEGEVPLTVTNVSGTTLHVADRYYSRKHWWDL